MAEIWGAACRGTAHAAINLRAKRSKYHQPLQVLEGDSLGPSCLQTRRLQGLLFQISDGQDSNDWKSMNSLQHQSSHNCNELNNSLPGEYLYKPLGQEWTCPLLVLLRFRGRERNPPISISSVLTVDT